MRHYSKKEIYSTIAIAFLAASVITLLALSAEVSMVMDREFETIIYTLIITIVASILAFGIAGFFLSRKIINIINFYINILDAMPEPVVVQDNENGYLFINKSAENLCELTRDKFTKPLFNTTWTENIGKYGINAVQNGKKHVFVKYKDRNYLLETTRLYGYDYDSAGYVSILRDNSLVENLFTSLDANILITDTSTDEIIFISDGYKRICGLNNDNYTGCVCHTVFGVDNGCPNCNKDALLKTPEVPIETEINDPVTKRTYRVTDFLILQPHGAYLYVRKLTDITERNEYEQFMRKRLEQQELMTAISLSSFSSISVDQSIYDSLEQAGQFLNCSRVAMCRAYGDRGVLKVEYEWNSKNCSTGEYVQVVPFTHIDSLYMEFFNHKKKFVIASSSLEYDMYAEVFKSGVKTFIAVPVYLMDDFWGVCAIECVTERKWDRSDISLALYLGNILSGYLRRSKTEADLMQMSSIANNSPQFITYTDLKGNFIFINTGATETTGYEYHEIQDGGLPLIFGEEMASRIVSEYYPKVMKNNKYSFEVPVFLKSGEMRMFDISAFFIADLESGIGMIASDITDRRRLETEIMEAKDAAEQASIAKSEFLYRMSYEIRTPITSICGMTDIAKTTKNHAQIAYCLEQVENASTYLLSVINDVLDMSKIEANKLEVVYDYLDLSALIRNVMGMFSFIIDRSRLNITVSISPDTPEIIISDKLRISQVLTNLLSNAVRFAPENGDITLSVSVVTATNEDCVLKIDVTDSGLSVASRIESPLFETLDAAGTPIDSEAHPVLQKYAGSGVVLSLAKHIAQLMGGTLTYTANQGDNAEGGVISFTLKARIGKSLSGDASYDDSADLGVTAGRYAGKHALLAEDVDINCDIFSTLLAETELEIDFARNGIEVCAKFREGKDMYDVIIMDIHMPEVNGFEATRIIREMDFSYAKEVPIIAFTADIYQADIDKCLEAGMDSHITKPMSFTETIKTLDKFLIANKKA